MASKIESCRKAVESFSLASVLLRSDHKELIFLGRNPPEVRVQSGEKSSTTSVGLFYRQTDSLYFSTMIMKACGVVHEY